MQSILSRILVLFSPLVTLAVFASPVGAAPFAVDPPEPNQTFVNQVTTFYSELTDGGAVIDHCNLSIDAVDQGAMTMIAGPGTLTTFLDASIPTPGVHTVRTTCYDAAETVDIFNETAVTVFDDAAPPSIGSFFLSPSAPVAGSPVTIQANYDDTDFGSGIDHCRLYVDDVSISLMNLSTGQGSTAGSASRDHTFTSDGSYSVKIECTDLSGNVGSRTESVSVSAAPDSTPPTVGTPNPSTAVAGSAVNISSSFSDNIGVTSCILSVDGSTAGAMDRSGTVSGTATRSYTFPSAGTYTVRVTCSDAAGNDNYNERMINVSAPGSLSPYYDRLIKLTCPTSGVIDVNHPCKAVYYVAADGKRHAFPNEKVFFTWYTNFDGVIDLDNTTMASIALGSNVTYRPGVKMVKFTTLNNVYAVGRYGVLRWVTSEAVATSLYGSDWNTKIDDISDAFYLDYSLGSGISSASSYDPAAEMAAVSSIDQNIP